MNVLVFSCFLYSCTSGVIETRVDTGSEQKAEASFAAFFGESFQRGKLVQTLKAQEVVLWSDNRLSMRGGVRIKDLSGEPYLVLADSLEATDNKLEKFNLSARKDFNKIILRGNASIQSLDITQQVQSEEFFFFPEKDFLQSDKKMTLLEKRSKIDSTNGGKYFLATGGVELFGPVSGALEGIRQ